ncbi:hypothetical protein ACFWG0_28515 [Streptomyces yangpuensis]|uniref:hypothetical protein n=1 Tax=Streptomyces yangpuensis TaxID=1648182 RepID=UPI003646CD5D
MLERDNVMQECVLHGLCHLPLIGPTVGLCEPLRSGGIQSLYITGCDVRTAGQDSLGRLITTR